MRKFIKKIYFKGKLFQSRTFSFSDHYGKFKKIHFCENNFGKFYYYDENLDESFGKFVFVMNIFEILFYSLE